MGPLVNSRTSGWLLVGGCFLAAIGLAQPALQGGQTGGTGSGQTQVVPMIPSVANADSNNRMIAVTGSDVTGASVLYLVDTETMHMAVYQANGGSESTQGIRLVGARRIDLDFKLDGFNDRSTFSYKELKKEFQSEGLPLEDSR